MVDKITYIPQQPIRPVTDTQKVASKTTGQKASVGFDDVLGEQIAVRNGVRFSGHAQQRMKMRNIDFNPQQMDRITSAIDRAAEKGARDSLLLVDNVAAVVSVENRTVITVVDGGQLKDNVFTNIDSAVIA